MPLQYSQNVNFEKKKELSRFVCPGEPLQEILSEAALPTAKSKTVPSKRIIASKMIKVEEISVKEWDRVVCFTFLSMLSTLC